MTKWRVQKTRQRFHWLYPWTVIGPNGRETWFSSWPTAMGYANREARKEVD